jgi:DNA-binding response OmpR family regulator
MTERNETAQTGPVVLVVEDEAAVCAVIHDHLDDEGYRVVCAGNDAGAYRELATGSFTALIVDINLGRGTTGFDVARHARRLDPKIAVVYVTGGPPESVALHGVRGAVLVQKPFDREDLLNALEETGAPTAPRGSDDDAGSPFH